MNNYLPTQYMQYIYLSRYARWLPNENRRENWEETVTRYFNFFEQHLKEYHKHNIKPYRQEVEDAVLSLKIVPSMRCMMTAGPALQRENLAGYNCTYVAVNRPQAFDEILYVLMNGTGVGFSVESKEVECLPIIAEAFYPTDTTIVVADSKLGWAKALKELIGMLYIGQIAKWDVSKVRPAGSPLRTFGGRASGPEPLVALFKFCVESFKRAAGRKLSMLECHDIVCKIADIVVVGGVRRSALISLSDLSDDRMRHAKSGKWWVENVQRALANNSAVYTEKPDIGIFMDEWKALYESKSGERGVFNRQSAKKTVEKNGRRNSEFAFGTNPCGEIILRSNECCNLSEVVVRPSDSEADLAEKVRLATILGTWQSTLTNFKYLSKKWRENCEEERLLGVSLTGIMDSELTNGKKAGLKERLENLKVVAIEENNRLAELIGIPPSAAITCGKPSGTVSQLVDAASGIHARHSEYYIRTVRSDKKDPLALMMIDMGFPVEDDVTKPDHVFVFSFPIKSPKNAVFRTDMTAIEQLELWHTYKLHWTEHNPSVTISVREHEWLEVGAWVYKNFDSMTGVSFLPFSEATYKQMPYQECTEKQYAEMLAKMPTNVDWTNLKNYEGFDTTTGTQELSCSVAGGCEYK
jgi:ribonucleoside-diphosphate reductase alpha chain